MINVFQEEMKFLSNFSKKSISISTTAKEAVSFKVLPRRVAMNLAMSSFMINDANLLKETLLYFDGYVDTFYIDIEQKQAINLYKIARETTKHSQVLTFKPNDNTLESCDMLLRRHFHDDLIDKKVIIIGTGNLASKIALRLSERQALVYIKGRTLEKEHAIVNGLNRFLPKHSPRISTFDCLDDTHAAHIVISFLSGYFSDEAILFPYLSEKTLIVDGGINNFSRAFIHKVIEQNILVTRLDSRIALLYQLLPKLEYTHTFFDEIYGMSTLNNTTIVSGGYIGTNGVVIVDNIKHPNQIIGIADGNGGVKADEQLTESDRISIRAIKEAISTSM